MKVRFGVLVLIGMRRYPHVREDPNARGVERHGDFGCSSNVIGFALIAAKGIEKAYELCELARAEQQENPAEPGPAILEIVEALEMEVPEMEQVAAANKSESATEIAYKAKGSQPLRTSHATS